MRTVNVRRMKILAVLFAALAMLLIARLWYIQVACHEEFAEASLSQQEIVIEGLDSRGTVFDRNLQPLTGGIRQYYYMISKKRMDGRLSEIAGALEARQIAKSSSAYLVYRTERYDRLLSDELKERYGAYVFSSRSRYADDQLACHFIGYMNLDEKRGVSGIELMYDALLRGDESRLIVLADAAGNILKGTAPSVRASDGSVDLSRRSVITTLDRRIQHVCQSSLERAGSGAAVVADAETGEILAWASSPSFNPNSIEQYLMTESDCLVDKAVQSAYAPGSVFKIVTAAAALRNGVCDKEQLFTCEGEVTVDGVTMRCTAAPEGGHGLLNMEQAMACSCNCYFAQLGQLTGPDAILETAYRLGFGQKLLDGFPGQSAGSLPARGTLGAWDVPNLSVGQGSLLATVMQVTKMTAVVANGGLDVNLSFISGRSAPTAARLLPAAVAADLESMMSAVMASGTGRGRWAVPVFGKTGTAEAVWQGQQVSNCWFTGYADVGGRRYVVTVLVERGASGAYDALPVFKDVVDFLSGNL